VLNDLCRFCGALPVDQLQKAHIQDLGQRPPALAVARHAPRSVLTIVLAAFNHVQADFGVANPLQGLEEAPGRSPDCIPSRAKREEALYAATDEPFRDFLFAAVHSGLRPFCELAALTADDVVESERGLMWRVYSSKTKKTRKIPVQAKVAELTRKLLRTAPRARGSRCFAPARQPVEEGHRGGALPGDQKAAGLGTTTRCGSGTPATTCRHTFAHRMLSGYWNNGSGCSIETLAELIGDTPRWHLTITAGSGGSTIRTRSGPPWDCHRNRSPRRPGRRRQAGSGAERWSDEAALNAREVLAPRREVHRAGTGRGLSTRGSLPRPP